VVSGDGKRQRCSAQRKKRCAKEKKKTNKTRGGKNTATIKEGDRRGKGHTSENQNWVQNRKPRERSNCKKGKKRKERKIGSIRRETSWTPAKERMEAVKGGRVKSA